MAYVALFLPDSNNHFFICLVPFIPICFYYFLILCFCFHLLFHSLLAKRQILQFTMINSTSLQPLQPARNISEIRNTSSHTTKKNYSLNHNQPNVLIFSWNKVWVFPSSLQNYFLFRFWSGYSYNVNHNQPNALIFSWNKVWVFPSSLQNYFLFSFWSGYRLKNLSFADFNEHS